MLTSSIGKRIALGSILRVASLVCTVAVSFFMMPFLISILGDNKYGIWAMVGSIVGIYGYFDFGLSSAVSKYSSRSIGESDFEQSNVIINTSLLVYSVLGVFTIVLSILASVFITHFTNIENSYIFSVLIVIMGTTLGLQFPLRTFSGILSSYLRFEIQVYIQITKLFVRTFLIVIFLKQGYGLIALAMITLVTEIAANAVELYFITRIAKFIKIAPKLFSKEAFKNLIRFSSVAFIANVTEISRGNLIIIFVSSMIGLKYVVFYSIALRLINYFEMLVKNAIGSGLMVSVLSRFDGEKRTQLMDKTFEYTTLGCSIIIGHVTLTILLYGEQFIELWMGEDYIDSYSLMLIMIIPFILYMIQLPAKDLLFSKNKHHCYGIINTLQIILMSVLGTTLALYVGGLKSISYSILFALTAFELIRPYFIEKALNIPTFALYRRYIDYILKLAFVSLVCSYFLSKIAVDSYSKILGAIVLQTIAYTILVYLLLLPKEIKTKLTKFLYNYYSNIYPRKQS